MSEQLIVAGFHRSGTSLVGQLLQRAGLFLGYDLLGAHFSNPYGHFEDVEIFELHEEILADNGLTWQVSAPFLPVITEPHWQKMQRVVERRNKEHTLWGFKDPRVCLFVMVWKHLLPNAKVLLVYRHFSDSTYSLGRRHSASLFLNHGPQHLHRRFWEEPDLGLRMWLVHNNALIAFARAYPEDTLAVSLDMVQEGFPIVRAINQRWGLGLDNVQASEVFDPTATVKRPGKQPLSDRRLVNQVEETWQALEQLSRQTEQTVERDERWGEIRQLSTNDFYTPTDIDALRMENELLAFEVRFLKSSRIEQQLEDVQRARRELQQELQRANRQLSIKDSQLAERDWTVRELQEEVRNLEELRRQLDARNGQLAEKEKEVAELTQEVTKRNLRLAQLERSPGERLENLRS